MGAASPVSWRCLRAKAGLPAIQAPSCRRGSVARSNDNHFPLAAVAGENHGFPDRLALGVVNNYGLFCVGVLMGRAFAFGLLLHSFCGLLRSLRPAVRSGPLLRLRPLLRAGGWLPARRLPPSMLRYARVGPRLRPSAAVLARAGGFTPHRPRWSGGRPGSFAGFRSAARL